MSAYWLLVAFAAVSTLRVSCEPNPAGQDGNIGGFAGFMSSLLGFKPCIDETCDDYHIYGPSKLDPKDYTTEAELPKAHCMLLRPSVVNLFGEIEAMYPNISAIKYRMLEEMIEYMHRFNSIQLERCQPHMQLIDLILLAANALKTQYVLQGDAECIYEPSDDIEIGKPTSDEVTQAPCDKESTGYETGTSAACPGSTMIPKMETTKPVIPKPTEKPYEPSSTQQITEKPYVPSSTARPTVEPAKKPCVDGITTEKPCQPSDTVTEEYSSAEEIEIIAEDESEPMIPQVGSLRGIPGVHYPNYTDIPITSFSCADKKYIPGFYADLDTGCQVFHVCYEHRRESFLCPVGTTFNQPILACDYWYSSNCSLACEYYDVNEKTELKEEKIDAEVEEMLTLVEETEKPQDEVLVEDDLEEISQFFPVKAIVTEIKPEVSVPVEPTTSYTEEVASEIVDKMATTATKGISGIRHVIKSIPEPVTFTPVKPVEDSYPVFKFKKPMKMTDLLKVAVVPLVKAKLASIPISKATALKTTLPVAGVAKAVVKAAAVPVLAKAKVAAAVPVVKAAAVPVLAKAKVAAAVPAAKVAIAAPVIAKAKVAAIPAVKAAAAVPLLTKTKVAVAGPAIAKAKVAIPAVKLAAATPVIAKGKIAVPAFKVAAAKKVVKSSMPALKAKMVASAIPLAKAKIVPFVKAKVAKSAGTPLLKAKMLALPLAKAKLAGPLPLAKVKLAKAAAISPLTKKALALGYMKLLKAKKVALMG